MTKAIDAATLETADRLTPLLTPRASSFRRQASIGANIWCECRMDLSPMI
jgi:hypothetical protein